MPRPARTPGMRYPVRVKLQPPSPGEYRYAVAIREGSDLWLTLWVRRWPKKCFVLMPRAEQDWTPHASYHADGTNHIKSYDHISVRRKGQALNGAFTSTENVCCFGGHGTGLAICDTTLFNGVVEVAPGVLGPGHGTVCVDLVAQGCCPVMALPAHKIVERRIIPDGNPPFVAITIYSPA